jgi:hypothetical protein
MGKRRLPTDRSYFYDYDEAAAILGYSPGYVKWLCDKKQLGYIVREWRYGVYKWRQRLIPSAELLKWFIRRLK